MQVFRQTAEKYAGKVAFIDAADGREWTYEQVGQHNFPTIILGKKNFQTFEFSARGAQQPGGQLLPGGGIRQGRHGCPADGEQDRIRSDLVNPVQFKV